MKNIMVLGAGALQIPLIECIKRRGYNPIVVSLHREEPGMRIVSDTVIADFCDERQMLQYARQYDIVAIVTDQTDLPVRSIAYVSDALGLKSIGYETACLFTDKYRMREKCKSLGIKTLQYQLVHNLTEAKAFFCSLHAPAILKPINNQGSKGVYKVESITELEEKYALSVQYARGEGILIEEFVNGTEFVIEACACDGKIENLICGDTFYFSLADTFSACQRIFPSRQDNNIVCRALELNKKLVKAFGLNRGLTHAEYIIKENEIYLIEIAARGGGVYISSDIIPLMTGFKTTDFILDCALQDKMEKPVITNTGRVACYIAFYLPEGIVERVEGVDAVKSLLHVHHNNLDMLYVGKQIGQNTDKTSRFFMVLDAESFEEMDGLIKKIRSLLVIIVEKNNVRKGIIWE